MSGPEPPADIGPTLDDVVGMPTAGPTAIRGSALQGGGYVMGWVLIAGASVLLVRQLGVQNFGRYATVMALVAVASTISDSGLTTLGQRELVQSGSSGERRRLVADILGIRLLLTPLTVAVAVVFAAAVGYSRTMVFGVLVAGAALLVSNANNTLLIPLAARLRFGVAAAANLVRDVVVVAGIVLLVAADAPLLSFFSVHVAAACAAFVFIATRVGRQGLARPRLAWRRWGPIVGEAIPMGVAATINVIYYRTLLITCSLAATKFQTGLFAASFRILEVVLWAVAALISTFFPILAHAGKHDERRLQYALQRMFEVAVLLAAGLVLLFAIGGTPIITTLGGHQYRAAGPVLQIQSFALLGSLTAAVWFAGIIAIRRQSSLIVRNAIGFVVIAALGAALVPAYGAKGAAIGAVIGETLLSIGGLTILLRARPGLRFDVRFLVPTAFAATAGGLCVLLPGVPTIGRALAAVGIYAAVAFAAKAVPRELFEAFRGVRGQEP